MRFADDQLIFLKDDNYQEVIFLVNKELNKIGLNLNAQKTKLMKVDELADVSYRGKKVKELKLM